MKVFAVLAAWALWVWTLNLPEGVKASLLKRYHDLLNEDMAIERLLRDSTRLKIADEYFRLVGFQARFLAYVPIPSGAKTATIMAVDPGVVIDRVGVR